ncbi:DUF2243 domain-containing protein [Enterovirga sp.]|uniref:DUF2243 domain-containing protein n=1 Tax=Enterovirga sp. TaxID=2026350 RepID=UPI00260E1FCF|nr:DUF2243 domain-containing protein [Enterovirga sp.]MDB5591216.1 hypothetical protein [Enterovirga sp.]
MSSAGVEATRGGNPNLAAGILGFALGGFIDGILLHQVLQWHHLLSLVEGDALRDIRVQILADGLFHVLMYGIAILGLWLLWRARGRITGQAADLRLVASALLGFGIWQVVDVAGFHWLAGIHRIRVDVPNPLVWDIGWLVVFAVPSLAAGWWLMRRADGPDEPGGPRLRGAPAALAATVLIAGPVALLPPPGVDTAIVVFRSGTDAAQAFAAVAAAEGRVVWASPKGDVLAVDLAGGRLGPLYANGALLVSTSPLAAGCLAWSRV